MGDLWRKNIPEDFDGRFGDRFDDEIKPKQVINIGFGIVATLVISILFCLWLLRTMESGIDASEVALSPIPEANERFLPSGPRLQAHPEEELEELRKEMAARLHGYGWVDEDHGLVHIPIEKAIDLVVDHGVKPQARFPAMSVAMEGADSGDGFPGEDAPSQEEVSNP